MNHALLAYGTGLVMISSRPPIGGDAESKARDQFDHGTACVYVAVDDPDAHYAQARAADARITMELVDQAYGSREYAARDPEGNVWAFGTYRPAAKSTTRRGPGTTSESQEAPDQPVGSEVAGRTA